jgi:hypothetical protein
MLRDYASIGLGERLRWFGGGPIIGQFRARGDIEAETTLTVWPSWGDWAAVYARSRDDFLADFGRRFPGRTPGAERVHAAYQGGGDGDAAAEAAAIAAERRADIRRVHRGAFGSLLREVKE